MKNEEKAEGKMNNYKWETEKCAANVLGAENVIKVNLRFKGQTQNVFVI